MTSDLALRIIYVANVIVAGQIGLSALFTPTRAAVTVFQNAVAPSEGLRFVGALWLSIAVLSMMGLLSPKPFSAVLVLQLMYKGSWLLVAALPAVRSGADYPRGMAAFFVVWVLVLPWVIPWRWLFGSEAG